MNHPCSEVLPQINVRVLLFDAKTREWKIARIIEHNNANTWVLDPKLYYALMPERFTHWTELPEFPNA